MNNSKRTPGSGEGKKETTKKTLSEMTYEELMVAQRVIRDTKDGYVRVQNFQSAVIYRDKEVRLSAELARRIEENFEV